jgi:UDP-hydrolysing UDP-N-acetyl-D-glucosamine 2-epimerase
MQEDKDIELHIIITGELLKTISANIFSEIITLFRYTHRVCIPYMPTLKNMALASAELQRACIRLFEDLKPDCCLALADRWEQLSFAVATAYMGIPLAHIQGGEVSGNIDDKVRNAISQMADIHFPSHHMAASKLRMMGLPNVHVYGCPSLDMIREEKITRNGNGKYIICIFHPHTKEIEAMERQSRNVYQTAIKFCKNNNLQLFVISGNNDPGAEHIVGVDRKINNLTGPMFLRTLANAVMIIGNSSAGIREASFLGVPSVNIGARQAGRIRGKNVVDTDSDPMRLYDAMLEAGKLSPHTTSLFGSGDASSKIINKIKEWRRK